jgi:outer membrane lipoprotein-sorting protein
MMSFPHGLFRIGWLCIWTAVAATAFSQAKNPAAANAVLEKMGTMGKDFRGFQANFTQKNYVAVLKEFDTAESGLFTYVRAKDGSALIREEFKAPGRKILTIRGGEAIIYQPSLNQATKVNLGKNKDKAEYLALGIGQTPAKMRETFDVDYQGEEKIDGTTCSILVLKPKTTAVAAYFSAITLWISSASNLPVQQKLQEPNGNYLLNKFSGEILNPKVSESIFEQKLPASVEVQQIR